MLYPKSKEPKLAEELFRNPTSEYRGTPFWAWNCKLEREELLWQLEVLKKMGLGGAHMHVRTGMATPYLSDEHMDLVNQYGIQQAPTLIVRSGDQVEKVVNASAIKKYVTTH